MEIESLFIPQIYTVKISLDPPELDQKYEEKIHAKILTKYGDTCYKNGYIRKSSIQIHKIGLGRLHGDHQHGTMTFKVKFMAYSCIPREGKTLRAKIKLINNFGLLAVAPPIEHIIIPRQIQQHYTLDLLTQVKVGDCITVSILDYDIKDKQLLVVGYMTGLLPDKVNWINLTQSNLPDEWIISPTKAEQPPKTNPLLGDQMILIQLNEQIKTYDQLSWNTKIIPLIDPYDQLIKANSMILSRDYYKLWEILNDYKILDPWLNQSINVVNLEEGPGGFIQALIDFRNQQPHSMTPWLKDTYYAITQKTSHLDWEDPKSKQYFTKNKQQGYQIYLTYGPEDGSLINPKNQSAFIRLIGGANCQLITANGTQRLSQEMDHRWQELADAKLLMAEILIALSTQTKNGSFVLRIGDLFYDLTMELIHLVASFYQRVTIVKPLSSHPIESDKYLIAQQFIGISDDRLSELNALYIKWLEQETNWENYLQNKQYLTQLFANTEFRLIDSLVEFNHFQLGQQIETINAGIKLITEKIPTTNIKQTQRQHMNEWYQRYHYMHDVLNESLKPLINELINLKSPPDMIQVTDIPSRSKYLDIKYVRHSLHLGQLKLFLSEVQFLTQQISFEQRQNNTTIYVIYAGSGPGHHDQKLADMFPNVKFILIDPQEHDIKGAKEENLLYFRLSTKTKIKPIKTINVATAEGISKQLKNQTIKKPLTSDQIVSTILSHQEYTFYLIEDLFDNALASAFNELVKRKLPVLMISDIRTRLIDRTSTHHSKQKTLDDETDYPSDLDILINNMWQHYWVYLLQPIACMLKFRTPFRNESDLQIMNQNAAQTIINTQLKETFELYQKDFGINPVELYQKDQYQYLMSQALNLQAFPGEASTEVRLISTQEKSNNYKQIISYDRLEHEEKLFYYNQMREYCFYERNRQYFDSLIGSEIGLDGCADCNLTLIILQHYIDKYQINEQPLLILKNLLELMGRTIKTPPQHSQFKKPYTSISEIINEIQMRNAKKS